MVLWLAFTCARGIALCVVVTFGTVTGIWTSTSVTCEVAFQVVFGTVRSSISFIACTFSVSLCGIGNARDTVRIVGSSAFVTEVMANSGIVAASSSTVTIVIIAVTFSVGVSR